MGRRYLALPAGQAPSPALDIAAIGCICLMAIVAVMEERKIRREKKIQQLTVA